MARKNIFKMVASEPSILNDGDGRNVVSIFGKSPQVASALWAVNETGPITSDIFEDLTSTLQRLELHN